MAGYYTNNNDAGCPKYIFSGESTGKLLFMIQRIGQVLRYDSNIPSEKPFGKIILKPGCNSWIAKRRSFYGWTIEQEKVQRAPGTYRWHKKDHILELSRSYA